MNYRFKTRDCPDADGRRPKKGEVKYALRFPLDEGGVLTVEISRRGLKALREILKEEGKGR